MRLSEGGKLCLNSINFGSESAVSSNLCAERKQVQMEKPVFFLQKRKKMLLRPKGRGLQTRTVLSADTAGHFCNIILQDLIQKALFNSSQ